MIERNDFQQQSGEWLQQKLGKVSGTSLKKVMAANNLDLIDELIAELGSGMHEESFVSAAMQRGIDLEPYVRTTFERLHGVKVDEIGLCQSDEFGALCLSPDGFSEDRTFGIEIKCPGTKKHVQYIRQNQIPAEYKWQIVNYFLVNGKCQKMYFISFDDRYKPKPYFEVVVTREEMQPDIDAAKEALIKFIVKLDKYRKEVEL